MIFDPLFDLFESDKSIVVEVKLIKQVNKFSGLLIIKSHHTKSDLTLFHASFGKNTSRHNLLIISSLRTHLDPITFLIICILFYSNTSNLAHWLAVIFLLLHLWRPATIALRNDVVNRRTLDACGHIISKWKILIRSSLWPPLQGLILCWTLLIFLKRACLFIQFLYGFWATRPCHSYIGFLFFVF